MNRKICKRCLLEQMDEDANIAALKRYIAAYPAEKRCEPAEYARRLQICAECSQLANAMCALCGCFVELRALKREMGCPAVGDKWKQNGGKTMLQFISRGSAFTDAHNCAFFRRETELVLMDCPMCALHPIMHNEKLTDGIRRIRVLVTHTHSDHIGGIPLLIHYAFYVLHIPVTVYAPSPDVRDDLAYLLERIEGCDPDAYTLQTPETSDATFEITPIRTVHAPALEGRCFGYRISADGRALVYTGDTCTLEPFLPYLCADMQLFTEAAYYKSGVHLYLPEALPQLVALQKQGIAVFLMHLDDEEHIRELISATALRLAPLWNCRNT